MKRISALSGVMAGLLLTGAAPLAAQDQGGVVSIGGSVTEIVYALGQEDRLVARDTTSTWPEEVSALPDVGYMRALSPEGVLSVSPSLILSEEGAGPPETISVLEAASVPFVTVPEVYSSEGISEKIRLVGEALGVRDEADVLAAQVERELEAAQATASGVSDPKRVLFILSTQGGRIMAAGEGSAADAIIRMSGAVNAMSGFEGYKPVSDEAVSAAAPDAILMMDRTGDHAIEDADLLAMPALRNTPAAGQGQVIRMNGLLLLGFGPRTASAVTELNSRLYGK
ncbi:heme/hemin ABC transporter substrate-binding protein [Amaricoccus tamworthensis]|uniref:heme/hemin ABC transporter substrate-binding protein n=1 Tax=Amaricoccus tamworthensis TaxID=57002 RepID=UPI003C7E5567